MNRIHVKVLLICVLGVILAAPGTLARDAQGAPTFESIKAIAKELASKPYVDDRHPLPRSLRDLSYDQVRDIRFNPREAVWRRERLPFQLQFFHPGGLNRDQIDYYLVDGEDVQEFPFSRDLFDYGANKFGWLDLRHLKFSGIRIHYPLNRQDYLDELAVFLGATYFRALPEHLVYGLSARAIAINCGEEGGEEFPSFRAIWVFRPGMGGNQIQVIGLFDGPSLAGGASFIIKPGHETVMDTRVAVVARKNIPHYGIAPLTSMFWYGKNSFRRFDDYRPEVHDSDGILMLNGKDEWLWRPLQNDGRLRLSSFMDINPKGFGLIQRERSFSAYQDMEAVYHKRPSAWVQPQGNWDKGSIRLVEIPTDSEFHDNIVAFWEPGQGLHAGETSEFSYQIKWFEDIPGLPALGRVLSTRTAAIPNTPRARKFVLDFIWPSLVQDLASGMAMEPQVSVERGQVSSLTSQFNPDEHTWRIVFDVTANDSSPNVELRASVKKNGAPCTETWTYLWMP